VQIPRGPLLVVALAAASLLSSACSTDDASPTDRACDRLVALGNRTLREGELAVSEYREEFAAAWTDAAQDPQSPIADPIDRSLGIIDQSGNGYLLPAAEQQLTDQIGQIVQACRNRP
jgi:hypothetical protein